MPALRRKKIENIKMIIVDNGKFSIGDFLLEFPDSGNVLTSIRFRANQDFKFVIKEDSEPDINMVPVGLNMNFKYKNIYYTIEEPGEFKNQDKNECKNINDCIRNINNWLNNLDDELKSIHIDILNDENIDDFLSKFDEVTDSTEKLFTIEEKERIIQSLNELQERVKQLEESQQVTSEVAIKTNEIIEISKRNLETYPKRAWLLMTYNKFKGLNGVFKTAIEFKEQLGKLLEWGNNIMDKMQ